MKYLAIIFFLIPFFSLSQSLSELEPYMEKYAGKWGKETDEYNIIVEILCKGSSS